MADTFTYDVSGSVGQVRMKIADVDLTTTTGVRSTWTCMFTDEEIEQNLSEANDDTNHAAALALLSIASSRALLAKVQKLGDHTEDLSKVAAELRNQAKAYMKMAGNEPAVGWAEQAVTDFAYRAILHNDDLRGS